MIERISTWEAALSEYIATMRDVEFEYGVNDCCTFFSGAVLAMTGYDPMQEFRGQYNSLTSSIRALREIGAGDLESTIDAKFPVIECAKAMRGDIAFYDGALGVVMGGFAYFIADGGLTRVPRNLWSKCWSVGR
jgi:hypothetical protein